MVSFVRKSAVVCCVLLVSDCAWFRAESPPGALSGVAGRDPLSAARTESGCVDGGLDESTPGGADVRLAASEAASSRGMSLRLGVAEAEVVVARPGWWLTFHNGTLQEAVDHRRPATADVLKTDAAGRVILPAIQGPFVLVVTHPSGYALLDGESVGAETIRLMPWGSVEGDLRLSGAACPNMGVEVGCNERVFDKNGQARSCSFDDAEAIRVSFKAGTRTDGAAHFRVSQLVEGDASVRPLLRDAAGFENPVYGLETGTTVEAGKTMTLNPGDGRRRVVGKLLGRKGDPLVDWRRVEAELFLQPPSFSMACFDDGGLWRRMAEAQSAFQKSDKGRLYGRKVLVSADGTFHIDNVPDGHFMFRAWVPSAVVGLTDAKSKSAGMAAYSFVLPLSSPQPGPPPAACGATVDLGDMVLAITESASS